MSAGLFLSPYDCWPPFFLIRDFGEGWNATDNGSENLGEFDTTLRKANIPHLFIYPRCPKVNSIYVAFVWNLYTLLHTVSCCDRLKI